jgi:2-polyprenyl-6-methoxyphenol hydroxylase-like FAD-dependent oxidoreductase
MNRSTLLVVGGGIGGMATAIELATRGCDVDLVEADPEWKVYGAGITLTGPTYRALRALGLLDEVLAKGFGLHSNTRVCDANGRVLAELPMESIGDLPPLGGIMRSALHEILSTRTVAAGVRLRLGVTTQQWRDNGQEVQVDFTDGSSGNYAGVVISDGAFSKNRHILFPAAPEPKYTGQYCWRLVADRPPEIDRGHIYASNHIFAGLIPTSADSMYLWLLEPRTTRSRIDPERQHHSLAEAMAPFGGLLGELRDGLRDTSPINVRPLDAIFLPRPWHRGRLILIGDAAHSTTPHLASGAGIAVEDGITLATLLAEGGSVEDAYQRFTDLRFERCRDVVESSVQIGSLQQKGGSPAAIGALIGAAESRLRADIWPLRTA